jgi:parallel beta-helix repeat protein
MNVAAGEFDLSFSADGYCPEYNNYNYVIGEYETLWVNVSLYPKPPENSVVCGYVSDEESSSPIADAWVDLYWHDTQDHRYWNNTYSNLSGFYQMNVAAGDFDLYFYAMGYDYEWSEDHTIEDNKVVWVNISLNPVSPMYNISGKVHYDGKKIGLTHILLFDRYPDEGVPPLKEITISPPGSYITQAQNGTYYLRAYMDVNGNNRPDAFEPMGRAINKTVNEIPDEINISGSDVPNVDITLFETQSYDVSGSIYYDDIPKGAIYIAAFNQSTWNIPDAKPVTFITMDNVGKFTIQLPNGSYYLLAFIDENGNHEPDDGEPLGLAINKTMFEKPTLINVTGTTVTGCSITLYDPCWFNVSGTIYYNGTLNGPVYAFAYNQQPEQNIAPIKGITCGGLGPYTMNLPNGTYYFGAYMDANNNYHYDNGEPLGFAINHTFGEEADAVSVQDNVSDVDITLHSFSLYNVSGTIYYNGAESGSVYIGALDIENNTATSVVEILDSENEYTLQVFNGSYMVAAFMDTNDNMQYDDMEPIGFAVNQTSWETADRIAVNGKNTPYINITLFDNLPLLTVYVDDNYDNSTPGWGYNHFNKIQDGIDAVDESGTAFVYNGTYIENIEIRKPLNLVGEHKNSVILDGGANGDVVYVSADHVNFSNCTVTNGAGWYPFAGIRVNRSDFVTVRDCIVTNNTCQGISFDNANESIIENNILSNNHNEMIIYESIHNTIVNNRFYNPNWGSLFVTGTTAEVYNHTVINNFIEGNPLEYYYNNSDLVFNNRNITHLTIANAENITIKECNITSGEGIHFAFVANSSINGNHIFDNYQTSIIFHNSYNNTIKNNNIHNNHRGMDLCLYNHHNTIIDNNIGNNWDLGIAMSAYGCNNTMRNNDIHNNSHGIALVQCADKNLSDNYDNVIEYNQIHHNRKNGVTLYGSETATTHGISQKQREPISLVAHILEVTIGLITQVLIQILMVLVIHHMTSQAVITQT